MDFKVAGTKDGITALQLDIKVESIYGDGDLMNETTAVNRCSLI